MGSGKKIGLALLATAVAATAQSGVVIPGGLGSREGNTYSYTPAGRAPGRSQFIYSKAVMPGKKMLIRRLRFRRDGNFSASFKAHTFQVEVWMANNQVDPAAGYSAIFSENRGNDFSQVFNKKLVSFPAAAKPVKAPASFNHAFVLDQPFNYQDKAFMVEFVTHAASQQSHVWYPDAESSKWSGKPVGGKRETSGTACPAKFYCYGVKPHIGQPLSHYGYSRVGGKSLAAMDMIGFSDTHFGPMNLPFALAAYGAPGCSLYVPIVMTRIGLTSSSSTTGYVNFDWGYIPNVPALVGKVFFEQQAVADPSFNGLGLRLSRVAKCTIGSGYTGSVDCLNLYGYGAGFTLASPVAKEVRAQGLVLELFE